MSFFNCSKIKCFLKIFLYIHVYLAYNIFIEGEQMNKLTIFAILLVLSTQAPLKAMLYCYLPHTVQKIKQDRSQYTKLAELVQKYLDDKKIDVKVSVCSINQSKKLYDPTKINELFTVEGYDILQIDVMFLSAIKQKLLTFTKQEFQYFDQVFPFQWDPVRRVNNQGNEFYIGSPGLMCSDFIQKRLDNVPISLMQAAFNSTYSLVSLYTGYYLNTVKGSTIDTMDYSNLNSQVLKKVIKFLFNCQQNQHFLEHSNNFCLNQKQQNFYIDKNFSTTKGYSQTIYQFLTKLKIQLNEKTVSVQPIMGKLKNKLVYLDQFIAKNNENPGYRETVKRFYKAMLDPEILNLYVYGRYTHLPGKKTYLLPPRIKYFEELIKDDQLYNQYYKGLLMNGSQPHPIYGQKYMENFQSLFSIILNCIKKQRILKGASCIQSDDHNFSQKKNSRSTNQLRLKTI